MGASWVQQQILEEHPHSDIKVYVVWFNMLSRGQPRGMGRLPSARPAGDQPVG
jgi:hypothetical protein